MKTNERGLFSENSRCQGKAQNRTWQPASTSGEGENQVHEHFHGLTNEIKRLKNNKVVSYFFILLGLDEFNQNHGSNVDKET